MCSWSCSWIRRASTLLWGAELPIACATIQRSAVEAVNAPRLHHQWNPDTLRLEAGILELTPGLEATGHTVKEIGGVGVVQAIVVHEDGLEPASDPRKGGRPAGW